MPLDERLNQASAIAHNPTLYHSHHPLTTFGNCYPKMDIKQIVNSRAGKGGVIAAVANGTNHDMHMMHPMPHNGFSMSDTGSERGNSPHDSEHSRYSAPRLMNNMAPRYPSPAAMQQPLLMHQQQQYRQDNGFDQNNMMQQHDPNRDSPRPAPVAPKAFPCSTCQKGFARRSDLARHGKHIMSLPGLLVLT